MKRRHQEEKVPGILCFISIKTGQLLVTNVIKITIWQKYPNTSKLYQLFAPCKGTQDRLGFWILCCGFHIPVLFSGTWTTDSNHQWDSRFLELCSGFQSPGFQIQQEKISQIPDSTSNSGIQISLHGQGQFVVAKFFCRRVHIQGTTVACHKLVSLVAGL